MPSGVPTGTVVAGFRVESLLGRGAMAEVYRARDQASGEVVALKLLDQALVDDERFRRRFLRESELAKTLDHPHVVATLDSGEDDGRLYLALELIDGANLRDLLRREGRLEPESAVALVEQVADALDEAHRAGLVHRDVKPGNILVRPAEEGDHAYICDFGLARHVSSVSSLTSDRGFVGTIDYVPPEQIEGGQLDGRADVYSLGCVLYECLAGIRPFERDSGSRWFSPTSTSRRRGSRTFRRSCRRSSTRCSPPPSRRRLPTGTTAAASWRALPGPRCREDVRPTALATSAGDRCGRRRSGSSGRGRRPSADARRRKPPAEPPPPMQLRANALNLVDLRGNRVAAHVPSEARGPARVRASTSSRSGDSAWVLAVANQKLLHVDLRTRRATRTVRLPWVPAARIAVGGGFV